jgi:hypothetical protein
MHSLRSIHGQIFMGTLRSHPHTGSYGLITGAISLLHVHIYHVLMLFSLSLLRIHNIVLTALSQRRTSTGVPRTLPETAAPTGWSIGDHRAIGAV